ncbi:hypothetical protein [Okeania sp. SIO2B9]|uniref:hypothetical protein n=1 Tax=Okeania sp. SIO2B9 TaxID=2607782 RepID=UPI001429B8BF|nr:hypothetical protein [Okeania sp. SIO2B9]NES89282.1 hypothetical protein [Okeania sp. SIO2B9]
MAELRFTRGFVIITQTGDIAFEVEKIGTNADAEARITFRGADYSDYFRRLGTAVKSMDSIGHFYSPARRLFWEKEEEGIKTFSVNVKSNEVAYPKTFTCHLSTNSNGVEEGLAECYCVILPKGSHVSDFLSDEVMIGSLAEYGNIDFKFMDWARNEYSPQLQPTLNPEINKLLFQPLGNGIFYITGRYRSVNTQQIPEQALIDYNNENGTSFDTKTREKMILPMVNQVEWDIPLFISSGNIWYKNGNFNGDWLKPLAGVWKARSKEVELKYDDGRYAVLFGNGQFSWDIDVIVTGFTKI